MRGLAGKPACPSAFRRTDAVWCSARRPAATRPGAHGDAGVDPLTVAIPPAALPNYGRLCLDQRDVGRQVPQLCDLRSQPCSAEFPEQRWSRPSTPLVASSRTPSRAGCAGCSWRVGERWPGSSPTPRCVRRQHGKSAATGRCRIAQDGHGPGGKARLALMLITDRSLF